MRGNNLAATAAALTLALGCALLYWPILGHGFVLWDSYASLGNNPNIRSFSWPHLRWMFTSVHFGAGTYQPMGWMAHALIYAGFGPRPLAFHAASLCVFSLDVALLFFLFLRLSGAAIFPCAAAAAVFAAHPVNVEMVAWEVGLPDLMAVGFFLASLLCYLSAVASQRTDRLKLLASWLLFGLSALCRWEGVCLPVIALILDRNLLKRPWRRIWKDKIPFALISLALLLVYAQVKHPASGSLLLRPVAAAGMAAFVLQKLFFPFGLMPAYVLFAQGTPSAFGSIAALAALTALMWSARHYWIAPWAAWLAYLAAVAPAGLAAAPGLVVAHDRYATIPAMAVAFLLAPVLARTKKLQLLAAVLIISLTMITRRQIDAWRDSAAMRRHIQPWIADENPSPERDLSRRFAAIEDARRALAAHPSPAARRKLARACNDLGADYFETGNLDASVQRLREAARWDPADAEIGDNLAQALYAQGEPEAAIARYRETLRAHPDDRRARLGLAGIYWRLGALDDAEKELRARLAASPNDREAVEELAHVLSDRRELDAP